MSKSLSFVAHLKEALLHSNHSQKTNSWWKSVLKKEGMKDDRKSCNTRKGKSDRGRRNIVRMKKCFSSLILFFSPLLFAPHFLHLSLFSISSLLLHLSLCTALTHLNHLLTFSWPDGGANATCHRQKRRNLKVFVLSCYISVDHGEVNCHQENSVKLMKSFERPAKSKLLIIVQWSHHFGS